MWGTCYLAFLASYVAASLQFPSQGGRVHLSPNDIAIDNKKDPKILHVRIKQSKLTLLDTLSRSGRRNIAIPDSEGQPARPCSYLRMEN